MSPNNPWKLKTFSLRCNLGRYVIFRRFQCKMPEITDIWFRKKLFFLMGYFLNWLTQRFLVSIFTREVSFFFIILPHLQRTKYADFDHLLQELCTYLLSSEYYWTPTLLRSLPVSPTPGYVILNESVALIRKTSRDPIKPN